MSLCLPTHIENKIWILAEPTGFGQYDFNFEDFFACRHPYQIENGITAIARMGATQEYSKRFDAYREIGISLIHTPEQYQKTSTLPVWYPLIEEFTPRSRYYDTPPSPEEIENNFEWPIFVKGERQTSKHDGTLSIIKSRAEYETLRNRWQAEEILWWQRMVCREFINLLPATSDQPSESMPKSYEFRSFWWKTECVGIGRYWIAANYTIDTEGESEIRRIGKIVAERIDAPFLVIDFAKTANGKWIVIECNDGQDSGYAGVDARMMWSQILDIEEG